MPYLPIKLKKKLANWLSKQDKYTRYNIINVKNAEFYSYRNCLSSKIQYNHPMTFYFSFCNKNYITTSCSDVASLTMSVQFCPFLWEKNKNYIKNGILKCWKYSKYPLKRYFFFKEVLMLRIDLSIWASKFRKFSQSFTVR